MRRIDLRPGVYFERWSRLYYIEAVTATGVLVEDCYTEVKTELETVVLLEPDVCAVVVLENQGPAKSKLVRV